MWLHALLISQIQLTHSKSEREGKDRGRHSESNRERRETGQTMLTANELIHSKVTHRERERGGERHERRLYNNSELHFQLLPHRMRLRKDPWHSWGKTTHFFCHFSVRGDTVVAAFRWSFPPKCFLGSYLFLVPNTFRTYSSCTAVWTGWSKCP